MTALLILVILGLLFRLSVQAVNQGSPDVIARVLNPAYFGYFPPAAANDDLSKFLRTYSATQPTSPYDRLRTHPPGNVVFYWLIIRGTDTFPVLTNLATPILQPRLSTLPDWIQNYSFNEILAGAVAALIVPFLSAASLVPLYYLGRWLWDESTARLVSLLYVFVPALTAFTPVADDLFTLITALTLAWVIGGLGLRRYWSIALGGLVFGAGLFMSFGLLPVGVIAGLVIVFQSGHNWRLSLFNILAFALGSVVVWGLAWLIFGLNPLVIYQNALLAHGALNNSRSYWLWLGYNPYDVLMFAGWPIALLVGAQILALSRKMVSRRDLTLADRLLAACLVSAIVLWLSGNVRGETARLLLFCYPCLVLFAARHVQSTPRPPGFVAFLVSLLAVQTVVFQISLNVYH